MSQLLTVSCQQSRSTFACTCLYRVMYQNKKLVCSGPMCMVCDYNEARKITHMVCVVITIIYIWSLHNNALNQ
jgi:hypothetical protein